ncbi:uncharacterized protein PgNI_09066 [Pyricularia grisea]|uniref:Uncharacterized protein n=1 Tax=Pyricularia grisea TaxID=148305 RepID=A0A6P8AT13_PYRGI|nr:uncharacterized protein PgNI_09066 [Pyricularia grisea]TLD05269.1 hypothetical protein PgNI_09066 [Pyricularia grisea]
MEYRPYSQKWGLELIPSSSTNKDFPKEFALAISARDLIYIYYIDTKGLNIYDLAAAHEKEGDRYINAHEGEVLIGSNVLWTDIMGWEQYNPVTHEVTYQPSRDYKGDLTIRDGRVVKSAGARRDETSSSGIKDSSSV